MAKLEKEIFIGCFSIRKLQEAKKLSEREVGRAIPVDVFLSSGKRRVTFLNWNRMISEAFNFVNPKKTHLSTLLLCNQIIHSYIYKEVFDEEGFLTGIFVSSDRERYKKLYFIALSEIMELFKRIGNDRSSHWEASYDEERSDYIVKIW
jgi:hypothetical protein